MMRSECVHRRCARYQEWSDLRLLSRALPWHHLRGADQEENPLLLLQPDRALPPHRLHGRPWIHSPARLGGKALFGWVSHIALKKWFFYLQKDPFFLLISSEKSRQNAQVGQGISVRQCVSRCQSICPNKPFQQSSITFTFHLSQSITNIYI